MRQICSICSKQEHHFYEPVEDLTKELLEFLLIKVNFTSEYPILCAECKEKILQSFEFKGKWILTDDMLYPYIKDTNGTKIDLKSIYFKFVKLEGNKVLKNLKICRLCLIEVNNNFYDLSEDVLAKYGIDRLFFRNFIPEVVSCTERYVIWGLMESKFNFVSIGNNVHTWKQSAYYCMFWGKVEKSESKCKNLDSIESPCMCEVCMQDLLRFAKFVTSLSTVEKSTEIASGTTEKVPNKLKRSAKKDAIAKLKRYSGEPTEVEQSPPTPPPKKPGKHKFSCEKCTYTTPLRRDIFRHFESNHAKAKCPHCLWVSDSKFALQMHIRKRHQANKCHTCDLFFTTASRLRCHLAETHKTSDRIYRCAECSFACTQRSSLNRHALRHAGAVKRHVCDECGFSAVFGHNLAKHKLVHRKPDRAPSPPPEGVHRCRLCPFTTEDKKSFSEHLYVHKYFSVTSEGYFKCVKCDFVNARINRLRRHALVHLKMRRGDKASNRIFDCDRCDFVTIYVESWRRHIDVHSSQRVNFSCNECPYVSKYRGNLAKHVLKHRRIAEGKKAAETAASTEDGKCSDSKRYIPRCSVCSFRAKNRSTYTRHLRVYGH